MVLRELDPDFQRLFKVKAQFAPYMDRTVETIRGYVAFIATRTSECGLLPFSSDAAPAETVHGLVQKRLAKLATTLIQFRSRARSAAARPAFQPADQTLADSDSFA